MTLFDRAVQDDGAARRTPSHWRRGAAADDPSARRVVASRFGCSYDGTSVSRFCPPAGDAHRRRRAVRRARPQLTGSGGACTCAGRTDAGVHATAPRSSTSTSMPSDSCSDGSALERAGPGDELPELRRSLDHQPGPEIAVWRAIVAPPGFDARRSAPSRRYRYDLDARPASRPVAAPYTCLANRTSRSTSRRCASPPTR